MSRSNLSATADKAIVKITRTRPRFVANFTNTEEDWSELRDVCDTLTGSQLDCQPLDILTDMVASRIRSKTRVPA